MIVRLRNKNSQPRRRARRYIARATELSPPEEVWDELIDALGELPDEEFVSAMIFLPLPADLTNQLTIDSGLEPAEMHVTVCYLQLRPGDFHAGMRLAGVAMRAALGEYPFLAKITGTAIFQPDEPGIDPAAAAVALVDSPGLEDLRRHVREALDDAGLPCALNHGFLPHVTLARGPLDLLEALPPLDVAALGDRAAWLVESIGVAVGEFVAHYPLLAAHTPVDGDDEPYYRLALAKADDVRRYTLAPLYAPGSLDTHDEWMTADDLQDAVWDYVRAGDRAVRLQHMGDVVAGEMVEIVQWPFEVRCVMRSGDGTETEVIVPPNTIWQGTVWTPWAYDGVLKGWINGLSLGGFAARIPDLGP